MPIDGIDGFWDGIRVEGQSIGKEIPPMRIYRYVSPGLFRTMGTGLIAGRDYTWQDIYGRRPAAAISVLPSARLEEVMEWCRMSTVMASRRLRRRSCTGPAYRDNYYTGGGKPQVTRTVIFAIRTKRADSESLLGQLNQAVWSVNSSLPLASVQTMRDIYDQSLARGSFTLVMLEIASTMALAPGIIGSMASCPMRSRGAEGKSLFGSRWARSRGH